LLRNIPKLALIALLCCSAAWAEAGTISVIGQGRWVSVQSVFDGDTFRTTSGEKVRLLGINAPEIAHGNQPAEAYGMAAKRILTRLIAGKSVQLQLDKDKKDLYGRTLAQVYLRNGSWVNNTMVQQGMAQVYTFAPNFRWTGSLLKSESNARIQMRGLWKSARFRVLDAAEVSKDHIGQFRLVRGYIKQISKWRFRLGKVIITVPRKSRRWFARADLPRHGQKILLRGRIRASVTGQLFLALHSPFDINR